MSQKRPQPTVEPRTIAGVPFNLTGLLEYVEGSIVSRILEKGPAGMLTVMAFDAGEEVSEHTTPCDAFALALDGAVEVTIGDSKVRLAAGDMVMMPAGEPHSLKALEPFKMLLIMLRK